MAAKTMLKHRKHWRCRFPSFSNFIPLPKSNFNLNSISRWHSRLSSWRGDDGEEEKRMLVECYSRVQSDPIRRQRHSALRSIFFTSFFFFSFSFIAIWKEMFPARWLQVSFSKHESDMRRGAYFLRLCAPYRLVPLRTEQECSLMLAKTKATVSTRWWLIVELLHERMISNTIVECFTKEDEPPSLIVAFVFDTHGHPFHSTPSYNLLSVEGAIKEE